MANIPAIRKVMEHIMANPNSHDQSRWMITRAAILHDNKYYNSPKEHFLNKLDQSECGTVACMAGWACAFEFGLDTLNRMDNLNIAFDFAGEAQKILDLPRVYADILFYACSNVEELWFSLSKLFPEDFEIPPGVSLPSPSAQLRLSGTIIEAKALVALDSLDRM